MPTSALHIIKVGGEVVDDENLLHQFLQEVSTIDEPIILVHGGGKIATELAKKLQIPQQIINGRRVTDKPTLDIATMVYAGLLNKQIVAFLQAQKKHAIGLSGVDNNSIQATQRAVGEHDFGFVGDVTPNGVNTSFLTNLLNRQMMPVFCAITHNGTGQLLNTNADSIAAALAIAMSPYYLVNLLYCFDKNGVLLDVTKPDSVIQEINFTRYQELVQQNIIAAGMLPKLENAFAAVKSGVQKVILGSPKQILKNLYTQSIKKGTHIVNNE